METYDTLEDRVLSVSNGEVVRKRPCVRIPLFVSALGVLVVVLMSERLAIVPACVLRTIGSFLGWCIAIYGIVLLAKCTPHLFEKSSGLPMVHYDFDFAADRMEEVMWLYESTDFEKLVSLCVTGDGGLRLSVVASADGTLCFSQMFKFIPYSYEPIEDVRVYRNVEGLMRVLNAYQKR